MDNYEILEQIGKGSFGIIQKIKRKSDGKILAWKEINYGKMSEREQQQLVAEVSIVQELKHPNVVRFYDKIINTKETKIYIVMEYCEGGDLSALLKKRKKDKNYLAEDEVWKMFSQVLLGINECHNFPKGKILHRDLKPANLFIDGAGNIKLGDFGLSRLMGDNSVFATTHVGTPYYMSPEQVLESNYDEKSDIWSTGCLLYEMCALRPPFEATNHLSLAIKIKDGKFERIPMKFSDDLQKLVEQMMHANPDYRPSVQKLLGLRAVSVLIKESKYSEDKKFAAEKESCLKKKEELFKEQRVKAYIKEKEICALENILKELEDDCKQLQLQQEELSRARPTQMSKQQIQSLQQLRQAQQNSQFCNINNNRSSADVELNKQTLNTFVKELMIRNNESSNSASKNSTTASSNGTFEYLRSRDKEGNIPTTSQSECVQPFQNSCEEFLSPRIPTARQNIQLQGNPTLQSQQQQLYLSPSSHTSTNKQNISSYYKSNPNNCTSPAQQYSQVYSQHIANLGTAIKMAQQSPFARGSSASSKQQPQQIAPSNVQQNGSSQAKTSRPRIISEIGSESKQTLQIQSTSNKNSSIFSSKQQHLRTSTSIDLSSQQTNLEAKYFLPMKVQQANRDPNRTQPNLTVQSQTNASYDDSYNGISQQQQPNNFNTFKQIPATIYTEEKTHKSTQLRRADSSKDSISKVASANVLPRQDNTIYQVVLQNIPPKPSMKAQLIKPQYDDKCRPNYQQSNSSFTTQPANPSSNNCNYVSTKPPKLGLQQQFVIQETTASQIPAANINCNFNSTEFNRPCIPKRRSNNSMGAGSFTCNPVLTQQNNTSNCIVNGNISARTTTANTLNNGNSTERGCVEYKKDIPSRHRNSSSNGSYQQIPKFYTTSQGTKGSQMASAQIQ